MIVRKMMKVTVALIFTEGKGNIETSSEDEDDMADLLPEESGF